MLTVTNYSVFCSLQDQSKYTYNDDRTGHVHFSIRTIELHASVLSVCKSRYKDEWSQQVASRFQCCNDRVAEEARYHKTCHDRFHLGKTTPLRYDKLRKSAARAADVKKQHSFSMMCNWLESQTDQYVYSIAELRSKLLEDGRYSDDEVYCIESLKAKLEEHYGNHVVFVEERGRATQTNLPASAPVSASSSIPASSCSPQNRNCCHLLVWLFMHKHERRK